jgi:hypothetical protein
MTITVDIRPEIEAELAAIARARGLSAVQYARQVLLEQALASATARRPLPSESAKSGPISPTKFALNYHPTERASTIIRSTAFERRRFSGNGRIDAERRYNAKIYLAEEGVSPRASHAFRSPRSHPWRKRAWARGTLFGVAIPCRCMMPTLKHPGP